MLIALVVVSVALCAAVMILLGLLDRTQRIVPGLSRLLDRGYRVFRLVFTEPDEEHRQLATDCRAFATIIRALLGEPKWKGHLAKYLTPDTQDQTRYLLRHLEESRNLVERAVSLGAVGPDMLPSNRRPFPVPVQEIPGLFEEIAKRLEHTPQIVAVSRSLRREIPESFAFLRLTDHG